MSIHRLSWNSASFSKFSSSSPSPALYKLGKKILETCVQRCLWGEAGWGSVCVNWKTPQKFKIIQRLLSTIVVCLHLPCYAQFSCQESVNRNQDSKQSAMVMQWQWEKIKRAWLLYSWLIWSHRRVTAYSFDNMKKPMNMFLSLIRPIKNQLKTFIDLKITRNLSN